MCQGGQPAVLLGGAWPPSLAVLLRPGLHQPLPALLWEGRHVAGEVPAGCLHVPLQLSPITTKAHELICHLEPQSKVLLWCCPLLPDSHEDRPARQRAAGGLQGDFMLDWATSPGAGARGAAQPGQALCVPLDPCLGSPEETRSFIPPLQSPLVCTEGSADLTRAWSISALLAMLLCWLM